MVCGMFSVFILVFVCVDYAGGCEVSALRRCERSSCVVLDWIGLNFGFVGLRFETRWKLYVFFFDKNCRGNRCVSHFSEACIRTMHPNTTSESHIRITHPNTTSKPPTKRDQPNKPLSSPPPAKKTRPRTRTSPMSLLLRKTSIEHRLRAFYGGFLDCSAKPSGLFGDGGFRGFVFGLIPGGGVVCVVGNVRGEIFGGCRGYLCVGGRFRGTRLIAFRDASAIWSFPFCFRCRVTQKWGPLIVFNGSVTPIMSNSSISRSSFGCA